MAVVAREARSLSSLFDPRVVAVVGASATPGKAGNVLMHSLESFPGTVVAVNPRGQEIAGRAGYARIADIPDAVDLALLAVPPQAVTPVLRECAAAGVGAAVVHSGGWAEAGPDGERLQAELAALTRETGLRVLGPNTSGFLNPPARLCASFVRPAANLRPGSLAIVAQSGGVNHALAFLADGEGLGIRLGVGLGNAVDVGFAEVLDHLAGDGAVAAVALAIEGVLDGRRLVDAVERLAERVPVIALKTGRTDVDAFSRSHTGALTGSWRTTRSALAQAGAVVVDDLTSLVDAAQALLLIRLQPAERVGVGVVTGQAGPGLLLADELGVLGVQIPALDEPSMESLAALLPPLTYQRNPVDTGRPGETFGAVLDTVAGAPGVDLLGVYLIHEPDAVDPRQALGKVDVPAVLSLTAPPSVLADARAELREVRVPVLAAPERTATAIAALVRDAEHRARRATESGAANLRIPSTTPGATGWDEDSAKALVEAAGLRTPRRVVAETHDEAHAAVAHLTGPLAVKLLHADVAHKSDVGGVHLGVADESSLDRALAEIDRTPGARYLLEEMAPLGPELLLGARRDPVFGPLMVLASGGTAVEADDDVSVRLAPLRRADAAGMLGELGRHSAFRGTRGDPAVDEEELVEAILAFGALIEARHDIAEVEVNPLRVTAGGLLALDALVVAS
jgi:acetyltransferase